MGGLTSKIVRGTIGRAKAEKTGDSRYLSAGSFDEIRDVTKTRQLEEETEALKERTKQLQREANISQEIANQFDEKARRANMRSESNNEISNTGNRGMLSGGTGFAKLKRRVLGSSEELGSNNKLGG